MTPPRPDLPSHFLVGEDDAEGEFDRVDRGLVAVEFDGESGVRGDEVVGVGEVAGAGAGAATVFLNLSPCQRIFFFSSCSILLVLFLLKEVSTRYSLYRIKHHATIGTTTITGPISSAQDLIISTKSSSSSLLTYLTPPLPAIAVLKAVLFRSSSFSAPRSIIASTTHTRNNSARTRNPFLNLIVEYRKLGAKEK